jgi:hypothetical protein
MLPDCRDGVKPGPACPNFLGSCRGGWSVGRWLARREPRSSRLAPLSGARCPTFADTHCQPMQVMFMTAFVDVGGREARTRNEKLGEGNDVRRWAGGSSRGGIERRAMLGSCMALVTLASMVVAQGVPASVKVPSTSSDKFARFYIRGTTGDRTICDYPRTTRPQLVLRAQPRVGAEQRKVDATIAKRSRRQDKVIDHIANLVDPSR